MNLLVLLIRFWDIVAKCKDVTDFQWDVTISRGRRGIRIFTPDKQQLRENLPMRLGASGLS